jgi:hypothetical protein
MIKGQSDLITLLSQLLLVINADGIIITMIFLGHSRTHHHCRCHTQNNFIMLGFILLLDGERKSKKAIASHRSAFFSGVFVCVLYKTVSRFIVPFFLALI